MSLIDSILGNRDHRKVDKTRKRILPRIDSCYRSLEHTTDLQQLTIELRVRLQRGEDSERLRSLAFAAVKEAVRRALGITMHDVQLIGGWIMCEGNIAEMMTGEGKTIVSLLPAYWFGLHGKGVHMTTVNEYLASRDCEEMGKVFRLLGLSVGLNLANGSEADKQAAYLCDITYGTCTEFGFDYLRDHMALRPEQRVQRALYAAIVDEVDSILIDEARTPLLIAGKTKAAPDLYYVCARFVRGLIETRDYEVDRETKQVMFTEAAIRKIEAAFVIDNLYELEHTTIYHYLLQSLRAKVLMKRDVDYIVADGQVQLIDAFTGRILIGRQFSEGLQQAIEAKEGVPLSDENRTHATITIQKFFGLYEQIVGMTGTIKTEEEEMRRIYGMDVVALPTHKPVLRQDYDDILFPTKEAKYDKVIDEIRSRHARGQPLLVGTTSVRQSEYIADRLSRLHVPFRLLNAKTEKEEADMVARAGIKGAVTIATNMAGRGTDIRLGEGVAELGGLHVIGTERHESRRVDNQLRGRAGRQGDPGSSQFFLSLEDELVERFAADEVEAIRATWKHGGEGVQGGDMQSFMERVQKRVEQQMLAIRSMVFRLDSIVHDQRQSFYKQRDEVLLDDDITPLLVNTVKRYLIELANRCCPPNREPDEWETERLTREIGSAGLIDFRSCRDSRELQARLLEGWTSLWKQFAEQIGAERLQAAWKHRYVQTIDRCWLDHLETLDQLKQGIHYQAYAQKDPIQAYQREAWALFGAMGGRIDRQISRKLLEDMREWADKPAPKVV